ncbi:50S ribosomal protein L11 methyltransferase [Micromonospora sp. CPCC 205371]|nr:50S ribosomal protein L11 methyltransferase [Micromonospora sp. CPCC 205371]
MISSSDSGAAASYDVTDKAFTTYDIQACLFDPQRVEYLRSAIFQTVKPGDVVVDAGSGSGLLGMFAAQAGAARVYCLELNPEFIRVIEENAQRNGLESQIIALHGNAAKYDLPEDVDVLISEVISAGFFFEPQLQIVGHLRKFLKPGGAVVPRLMKNYVELINAQNTLYGLRLDFDSRFTELAGDHPLSHPALYLSTGFLDPSDPTVDARVRVTGTSDGNANAVKITYDIEFAEGIWADTPTEFLLNPQIIFLPEPVRVQADQEYEVSLNYLAGDSPLTCKIGVLPASA